jgi:hypothetical protein
MGLPRLQAVADALGVQIHERVVLPTAAAAAAGRAGRASPADHDQDLDAPQRS